MSGAVQRFLDRATGAARPGLRPRLPGRFEGTGFLEVSEDIPVRALPVPTAAETVPAPAGAPISANPDPQANIAQPIPSPLLPQSENLSQKTPSLPNFEESAERSASPLPQHPVPDPLVTESNATRPTNPKPVSPSVMNVAQPTLPETAASRETRGPSLTPPEPLLPVRPTDDIAEQSLHAVANYSAQTSPPAKATIEEAAPAEITIHIGRLDIAAPKVPQKLTRAKREPVAMPSLKDHLNGGVT